MCEGWGVEIGDWGIGEWRVEDWRIGELENWGLEIGDLTALPRRCRRCASTGFRPVRRKAGRGSFRHECLTW
ncbi:MAG: hypothetical protein DYH15_14960 [Nitrosomonas sp. PRO4]|nr:hypothetical protein [Nitrosomonas sp. PRO4]